MTPTDRELGMSRPITRRDFIHDVGITALGMMLPLPGLAMPQGGGELYYPPTLRAATCSRNCRRRSGRGTYRTSYIDFLREHFDLPESQLVPTGTRVQDAGMRRAARTVAIVSGVIASTCIAIGVAADATDGELSIEETQVRLMSRLARESHVAAGELRMIEASPQTWPDSSLGCQGGRRALGTSPVPGYRFVVDAGGKRRTYHADTRGRIVRCDAPSKPLDPIARQL